tara:strand:+ start:2865 stop:4424 length:1560 start_codon:yes stop_codon:yes gene_type:complete
MEVYLVGGAVRDKLLGKAPEDKDYVVVGSSPEDMEAKGFLPVGRDFTVFLHPDSKDEYALARKESSTGNGYNDFEFDTSCSVTLAEDLFRRDLTMNAIAYDEGTETLIDPYDGHKDIANKKIRHVSPHFSEDPLRVLRVCRFMSRYHHLGFTVADETLSIMKSMVNEGMLDALTPERIAKEMLRALTETSPQAFFETLDRVGGLDVVFPELAALKGKTQPAKHHPEIDTFIHQMMVLEQARKLTDDVDVMVAALCHDFGKGLTPQELLPHHHGHEKSGVPLVKNFGLRLKLPKRMVSLAALTSEYHTHIHRAKELTAPSFMLLLERFDAFRSGEEQFKKFLIAAEADAKGRLGFEDRNYDQRELALLALEAAKEAHWDKKMLLAVPPEFRKDFIYKLRLERVKKRLHHFHAPEKYRQYREQYDNFLNLTTPEKLNVLCRDKGDQHGNYVAQALAISSLSEEDRASILKLCSKLQEVRKYWLSNLTGNNAIDSSKKRALYKGVIESFEKKMDNIHSELER